MQNQLSNGFTPPRGASPERSERLAPRQRAPNPQAIERATRRRFTAEYKSRIVREADRCREPGVVGALLRREDLYSSLLSHWRAQVHRHGVVGLASKKCGPSRKATPGAREVELERENRRLEKELAQAKAIIEFQEKAHELLGIPLRTYELDGSD